MIAAAAGAWPGVEVRERRDAGWAARGALLVFAFSVPIDALDFPGNWVAPLASGGALAGAAVLAVAHTRSWRPAPAPLLWLLAYTAWSSLTLLWARDLQPSLVRAGTTLQLMISLAMAWQVARARSGLRATLAGFVLGCGAVAVGAWRSFLAGVTHVEMKFGPGSSLEEARYVALGFDPNDMGLTLSLGILMAGYLGLTGEGRGRRLWLAALPLALSAVALSGSRGAAVAAATALAVVLWWLGRQNGRALVVALGLLAAGAAAVWLQTPETWERIFTVRQQLAGGTLGERVPIWRAGWSLFLENPVAGVGVGAFQGEVASRLGYPIVAHSTPLSVAAETGLVGFALYYGAVAALLWGARALGPVDRGLVVGLLVTWFVGAAALTWEYRKTTWLVLLIAAVVGGLARERAAEEGA